MTERNKRHLDATDWLCETCGNKGRIEYARGSSIYDVLQLLEDSHLAASGGKCGDRKMRVTPVEADPNDVL